MAHNFLPFSSLRYTAVQDYTAALKLLDEAIERLVQAEVSQSTFL